MLRPLPLAQIAYAAAVSLPPTATYQVTLQTNCSSQQYSIWQIWYSFSALTLLVGWQGGHLACKKIERWGAGTGICPGRGADLHMAQLMPLPSTVSCFSKTQIRFIILVPAQLGRPAQRAVKQVLLLCRAVRFLRCKQFFKCLLNVQLFRLNEQ